MLPGWSGQASFPRSIQTILTFCITTHEILEVTSSKRVLADCVPTPYYSGMSWVFRRTTLSSLRGVRTEGCSRLRVRHEHEVGSQRAPRFPRVDYSTDVRQMDFQVTARCLQVIRNILRVRRRNKVGAPSYPFKVRRAGSKDQPRMVGA